MRAAILMMLALSACPEPVDSDTEVPLALPMQVVTPTAIEFGDVQMGRAATPKQVTISNTGTGPLDVYDIYIPKDDEPFGFSIGSVGGGQRIRAGSQGSFIVELVPNGLGEVRAGVVIESNVTPPGEGLEIPISANAVKADPQFDPAGVEIADASAPARIGIEIRNLGAATLQITGATVEGSPAFGVDLDPSTNGTLPIELEQADSANGRPFRTIFVTFDPDLAEGADAAELKVSTNEWLEPETTIPLSVVE